MTNRRDFLRTFAVGAAGLSLTGLPLEVLAKRRVTKITILHTNDVHSHIDPFPANDPKYPGLGGVAQRAAIINDIRNIKMRNQSIEFNRLIWLFQSLVIISI